MCLRYIDDTFLLWSYQGKMYVLLDPVKSIRLSMQFTMEKGQYKLDFQDILNNSHSVWIQDIHYNIIFQSIYSHCCISFVNWQYGYAGFILHHFDNYHILFALEGLTFSSNCLTIYLNSSVCFLKAASLIRTIISKYRNCLMVVVGLRLLFTQSSP